MGKVFLVFILLMGFESQAYTKRVYKAYRDYRQGSAQASESFCKKNPKQFVCQGTKSYCEINPRDFSCQGTKAYCAAENRLIPVQCQGTEYHCKNNPTDISCFGTKAFCDLKPKHQICQASNAKVSTNIAH